jgi:thioredoxin 1
VSENVRVFTAENWEQEVLKSAEPVLVDFWAEWCPPCRALAPSVESLATNYRGRVKVGKLNVDDAGDVAGRYGITSIPTLLVFRGGKIVDQRVGALPLSELARFVDPHAGVPAQP